MSEHRETLGMPDILEEYPVPGPRTLDGVLGFRVLELGENSARGDVPYADGICQRFGVVHGGTYAAFAEMLATEATVHNVWAGGSGAMGSSNNTCFLRPITSGTIHAEATARHRGRTTWVWDIDFTDDEARLCASSRVTIAVRPRH
jgi:1,4-dihydroxy-2-naphthoyl-CoA hydrolase